MFEQVEREAAAPGAERAGSDGDPDPAFLTGAQLSSVRSLPGRQSHRTDQGLASMQRLGSPPQTSTVRRPREEGGGTSITAAGSGVWIEAPPLSLDRGCLVAGRYQIEDSIGSGGSGRVFRAFDRATGTLIALKVLKPEMAREAKWLERLNREVRVARQIQHDHVIRIWDVGEAEGLRFITMELATGGTLRRAIPNRPWSDKVRDAQGALAGLVALHRAGIVHRDVKPENFLRMEDGRLVLSDFGLATDCAAVGTVMVGTPFYMAPEVVMGEQSTVRADVWAMGVVLHELFFGVRPEWEWREYRRVINSPLSAQATRLERRVFELCRLATSDNPDERPADGVALAALLERALAGKRSRTTSAVLRRQRRHVGVLWASTTLLGLSVLVLLARGIWLRLPEAGASSSRGALETVAVDARAATLRRLPFSDEILDVPGELHCVSELPDHKTLFVVWGPDRTAEEVDIEKKQRRSPSLPPEVWRVGCPQVSAKSGKVLFEADGDGSIGRIIKVIDEPGRPAHTLTAGSSPLWIPQSDDFIFNIDESHAAVYSLAQRTFALAVGTDPTEGKILIRKAISPDGKLLATKHLAGPSGVTVLVRSLPSLEVVSQIGVGPRLNGLRFDDSGRFLRFATGRDGRSELQDIDWRTGQVVQRLATDGDGALEGDLSTAAGLVGVRDSSKHQVWLSREDALDRALVTDGANFFPSRNDEGDVFFVSLNHADARVIRRWDHATGSVATLTNGPYDMWPSPAPHGGGWVYVEGDTNTIVHCPHQNDARDCRKLSSSSHQVFRPVLSPDAKKIAYLAAVASSLRAFVHDLESGDTLDLGPALNDEAPIWTAPDRPWFVTGPGSKREWTEFLLPGGKPTGRAEMMRAGADQSFTECGAFPFLGASSHAWACTRSERRTLLSLLSHGAWR